MMRKSLSLSIILFLFLLSCKKEDPVELDAPVTSSDLNLQISFDNSFENTIYPSLILGLSNYSAKENKSFELIKYSLTNPKDNCSMKIKLAQSTVNNETIFQEQLAVKGSQESFYPQISWNYENLKSFNQQANVDLSFTCYIDNKEVDNQNLRLSYRSVNECVYGMIDEDNNYVDLKWMFAAYVNEDHPQIDVFLQEVLKKNIVNSFIGYQGGTENSVLEQVYALWYTLQTKNVKYSSITNTSNPSDKIFTQHVRFFDEVYNNTQANCVDGSVFLSSILKKIDIKPFLVLSPGHMYLGFYTTSDKSSYQLLETTMIGNINLNEIYEENNYVYNLDKYRNYLSQNTYDGYINGSYSLDYVKKEISKNHFQLALNENVAQWNSNLSKFNDSKDHQYQTFDIEKLREIVQPISR